MVNAFYIPTPKSLSREVREGLTEKTVLKVRLKRCVGVGQVDGAWRAEAGLPQANTSPFNSPNMTVDSSGACRPCSGFCSPNISGS